MSDFSELLAQATPRTERVTLCLRGDLTDRIDQLIAAHALAQADDENSNSANVAPDIAEEIIGLIEEADENSVDFVLRSIGARAWSDLLADHPPSADDMAMGRDHDSRTFPLAALAASITAPEGATPEMVTELEEKLSAGAWQQLWTACLAVNIVGGDIPKFAGRSAVHDLSAN